MNTSTHDAARGATYRALGYRFTAGGTPSATLTRTLASLRSDSPEDAPGRVAIHREKGRWAIEIDGEYVGESATEVGAVAKVVWHVTQRGIATRADGLVVHAGAISAEDTVVIVSGRSGTGKSTLCATLLEALPGARYLTDEALEVGPTGRPVDWIPRSLALDQRSLDLVAADPAATSTPRAASSRGREVHYPVDPDLVHTGAVPTRILLVMLGEHAGGLHIERAPRSRAVATLIGECFEPGSRSQDGLERVERLTRHCATLWVRGGTPHARVDTIRREIAANRLRAHVTDGTQNHDHLAR